MDSGKGFALVGMPHVGKTTYLHQYRAERIQVCADLSAPETFGREMRALQDAGPLFPNARQRALTAESRLPMPETPEGVTIRPAWE